MEFEQELMVRTKEVEACIASFLPKEENDQAIIMEAMNYSVLAGGKRLRPMLILETYRMFGGEKQREVEPFMAAMEMIHTYSLVHDDLPAMDNDLYRRGRKTTHAVYGEAMGILAGDALLNYAFETVSSAFDTTTSLELTAKAFQILARKSGIYGMIGGQVVDVLAEKEDLTHEKIEYIHRLKTSALIEASMMMGATLAGATKDDVAKIEQAAGLVGLSFQIQDDILDITSSLEVLGKSAGIDEKNQKVTYVTLRGLTQSREAVREYSEQALAILKDFPYENQFLLELITALIYRKK
ncbi:MAG: geranylgeranyl diphosphate synthase, type [Clostridiales bacterium]|nr:geranylgeranyl diphosphate synthase, type [Clostridiales bacterium]